AVTNAANRSWIGEASVGTVGAQAGAYPLPVGPAAGTATISRAGPPPAIEPAPLPPAPSGLSGDVLSPGTVLGRYRIEGPLGGGGMGNVYRSVHIHMQRPAALKVLH